MRLLFFLLLLRRNYVNNIMYLKSGHGIKKAIAFSFLLLANAVILAHAIVCHHHYEGMLIVCAHHEQGCNHHEQGCNHHEQGCNHHEQGCNHHDDTRPFGQCHDPFCHGDFEGCSLTMIVIKLVEDKQLPQLPDFCSPTCDFTLFSGCSIPPITDDTGLPFRQKPYLLSFHIEYISQSLGLRAPPTC